MATAPSPKSNSCALVFALSSAAEFHFSRCFVARETSHGSAAHPTVCLRMSQNTKSPVDIAAAAQKLLGFRSLRPGQREAIQALLEKRDTLLVQPTGSGKSAVYQIAGSLLTGSTVIVSPLIAFKKIRPHPLRPAGSTNVPSSTQLFPPASSGRRSNASRGVQSSSFFSRLSSFASRKPSIGFAPPAFRSSSSMRRIASANGATTFGPTISSWRMPLKDSVIPLCWP